ncbi:MAG TPA: hypothetical protein VFZ66_04315 [Herpetosiphonaceae bacterium]
MSQPHGSPDRELATPTPPGTPRWVKVFVIVVAVVVLLFVIMAFAFGGNHGPGRHMPPAGAGGYTLPIAHGVQQL